MVTQSCKYGLLYGDKNNKQEEHGILVSFIGRHTNFYSCINLLHLCVKKIKVLIFYLFPYIYTQAIISGLLSTLLIAWANFSNEHFLCHRSVLIWLLQCRTGLSLHAYLLECVITQCGKHTRGAQVILFIKHNVFGSLSCLEPCEVLERTGWKNAVPKQ